MGKIADRITKKSVADKKETLVSAYWGYHPATATATRGGFELSNYHLTSEGLDDRLVDWIIETFYDLCQTCVSNVYAEILAENDPLLTKILDHYQRQLDDVVAKLDACDRSLPINDFLKLAIVACASISALVAGGRLVQDDLNGDSFVFRSR